MCTLKKCLRDSFMIIQGRHTVGQDRKKCKETLKMACMSGLLVDKQQKMGGQVENTKFSETSEKS